MTNPSKQKGTDFEVSLLPLLQEFYGPDTDRRPPQGANDKGDFLLPGERRFILEAKNRTQMALGQWLKEADVEAGNFDINAVGVVVHKRKGTRIPAQQFVTMTLGDFLILVNSLSKPNLAET